jgi:hypothetical protein
VQHALLRHLGRRLVWALEPPRLQSGDERVSRTFRVAEDLSFANEADQAFVPEEGARVMLVHPVLLTPELRARWIALFGDYAIVQPFAQLGREVFTVKDEEHGETQLASAQGATTSRGRLFGLTRRGWTAQVEDGFVAEYARELPCGARARIAISPGMAIGGPSDDDATFTVTSASCTWALDRLPAIDYSELVRDVDYICRTSE